MNSSNHSGSTPFDRNQTPFDDLQNNYGNQSSDDSDSQDEYDTDELIALLMLYVAETADGVLSEEQKITLENKKQSVSEDVAERIDPEAIEYKKQRKLKRVQEHEESLQRFTNPRKTKQQ
jgi:hypothetical protein